MIRTIHRAKYVLAEIDLVLTNAALHISEPGRISRVEPWQGMPADVDAVLVDWGDAVILPGLVNAHTHLELTALHGELTGAPSFTDWLIRLIQRRREWRPEDYLQSAAEGARLSLSCGTTLVGDISSNGLSGKALKDLPLRKVVFEETLGFLPEKVQEAMASLRQRLEAQQPDALLSSGVAPHAPYSVSPDLYRAAAEWRWAQSAPMTTHVAETLQEILFVESGVGEFREFLSSRGLLPAGWSPPGLSPVAYLQALGVLENPVLLAHCNYLDAESLQIILKTHCSVVYCPRSHAFFGHAPHPVRQLLDMGVNVALGTDSLASNDSLSMLDEMRFLAKLRPDLKPDEILRMATLNGAAALQFGGSLGRIRRGYIADLTVLKLTEQVGARNLAAQILEGAGECIGAIVHGQIAWKDHCVEPSRV